MPKRRRMGTRCIFCQKFGNKSKEHIWPVWMKEYLLEEESESYVTETTTSLWNDSDKKHLRTERPGHLSTLKVRAVCADCNNGWMSVLEAGTKDIFQALTAEKDFELTEEDQMQLSRWAAMKVIVGEHAERNLEVTPTKDRFIFRKTYEIPPYFAVYIGTQDTDSRTAWLRYSCTLSTTPDGPSPPLNGLKRNSQAISFLCGPLYILILTIRENGIDVSKFASFDQLSQIHPIVNSKVTWPTQNRLTLEDLRRISNFMDELKSMPNVNYGANI